MDKLTRIEIDGEEVCIRKSFDGPHVVYPLRNADGSFNMFNFVTGGNYWKLIKLGIFILLIIAVILLYRHDTQAYEELTQRIREDPYGFCQNVTNSVRGNPIFKINLSGMENIKVANVST